MNFLPEIRLRPTRNSASILSYSRRFDSNKKLVFIRAIEEPPVGILNIGHTNSCMTLKVCLNYSMISAIVVLADTLSVCSAFSVAFDS